MFHSGEDGVGASDRGVSRRWEFLLHPSGRPRRYLRWPCLTTFCRICERGLEVDGRRLDPGCAARCAGRSICSDGVDLEARPGPGQRRGRWWLGSCCRRRPTRQVPTTPVEWAPSVTEGPFRPGCHYSTALTTATATTPPRVSSTVAGVVACSGPVTAPGLPDDGHEVGPVPARSLPGRRNLGRVSGGGPAGGVAWPPWAVLSGPPAGFKVGRAQSTRPRAAVGLGRGGAGPIIWRGASASARRSLL